MSSSPAKPGPKGYPAEPEPKPEAEKSAPVKSAPALASLKARRDLAAKFTALAVFQGDDPRARLETLIKEHLAKFSPAGPPQAP